MDVSITRSYEVDQVATRQVAGVIINFLRRRLSGHDHRHRLRGALPCSGVERRPVPAHVAAERLPRWEHDAAGVAPVHVAGGGALAGARAEQEVEAVGARPAGPAPERAAVDHPCPAPVVVVVVVQTAALGALAIIALLVGERDTARAAGRGRLCSPALHRTRRRRPWFTYVRARRGYYQYSAVKL